MQILCDNCARRYYIDESEIKWRKARFSCTECGHVSIIDKLDIAPSSNPDSNAGAYSPQSSPEIKEAIVVEQFVRRAKRGIPLFVYFIIAMLFALVSVNLVTIYLYTDYLYNEYLANTLQVSQDSRSDIMLKSSLVFGAGWFVILTFFIVIAHSVHQKFKTLIRNANELSAGRYDIDIVKKGPREVRDLAFALERIRKRFKGGVEIKKNIDY